MSKALKYKTVDEYFENQSAETRKTLLALRRLIKKTVLHTEELFNYEIPAYTLVKGGKRDKQIMMTGYKDFVGFYTGNNILNYFSKELAAYKTGKASVQFPNNEKLPEDLIIKIIKYKMKSLNGKES